MRRAKDELGTDDIATIVRNYQGGRSGLRHGIFTFPSRRLGTWIEMRTGTSAALTDLPHDDSRTVRLPNLMPAQALEKTLGTDRDTLRALNSGAPFNRSGPGVVPSPAALNYEFPPASIQDVC
jgi:hypothetical protein